MYLVCFFSVLRGNKSQLQADVRETKNEELSKFELPNKPKNPVQEVESFKKIDKEIKITRRKSQTANTRMLYF